MPEQPSNEGSGVSTLHDPWQLEQSSGDGRTEIWHLRGVAWWDAPIPRRWHRCTAQTRGTINYFEKVERCACGAFAYADESPRIWLDRNSRKPRG